MLYVILVCFYSYLIIRLLLFSTKEGKNLSEKIGTRLYIFDYFIIVFFASYLFNYYFNSIEQSELENFIIPRDFILMIFTSSLFLLGIGLGVKFILEILTPLIQGNTEIIFSRNKEIYEIFSSIWVSICSLVIIFTYVSVEISEPIERISDTLNLVVLYSLSFILGALFYQIYTQAHFITQKVSTIAMLIISLCLVLFIYESGIDYLKALPITTSFIIFNVSFFISFLLNLLKIKIKFKDVNIKNNENFIGNFTSIEDLKTYVKKDPILNVDNYYIRIKPDTPFIDLRDEKLQQPHTHDHIYTWEKTYDVEGVKYTEIDNLKNKNIRVLSLKDLKVTN